MLTLLLAVALLPGIDPPVAEDLEKSYTSLKEAASQNDPALVKNLAVRTSELAHKLAAEVPPADETDKETWAKQVAYAKDVSTYAEYALCQAALKATAPATAVDLISTLEKENPSSKYLDEAYGKYFVALKQTGAGAKIPDIAATALKRFPNNEDLLLVLADDALNRKQNDRALGYANRLITVLDRHPKPEGVPAAEWDRKKSLISVRAHWMAGVIHAEKTQYFEADKDLRAALPGVKGDDVMLGSTLFYLGLANYQLGAAALDRARVLEAANFSDQAAKIKSPYAEKAWRNATAMRAEAEKMRLQRR